ncbi:unnamed protein product [Closterium sp. NIES-65]|nr:unnamed protein product [Closterium sp. NIES-65]CAI6010452.1 unnamed protein product [Closterium sp. NIES-65]
MDTPASEPALASDSSTSAEDVEEVEIEVVDEPRRADFQEKVRRLRQGVASMFVDADRVVLVTSNIEAERITAEELAGLGSIQVFAKPWFWDDSAHLNRSLIQAEPDTGDTTHSRPPPISLIPPIPLNPPTPPTSPIPPSRLMPLGRGFKPELTQGTRPVSPILSSPHPFLPTVPPNPSLLPSRLMTLGRGFKPEPDTGDILTPIFAELRATLTPFEVDKYRVLARQCGELLGEVARGLRRGMTEKEVAGAVAGACYSRGIHPILLLVGADERMDKWRHPLPTSNVAKSRLVITLSGRRHGLIASLSRVVHFGPLPSDSPLRYKHTAVTYVDSVAIASTRVGATSDAIMARIQQAYEERGFRDEWLHHHQGGATGYRTREWKAEPGVRYYVGSPQAFAWNPSIAGTRSEDTILVGGGAGDGGGVRNGAGDGGVEGACPEVLTATPDWPMIRHVVDGIEIMRPDVLEIMD